MVMQSNANNHRLPMTRLPLTTEEAGNADPSAAQYVLDQKRSDSLSGDAEALHTLGLATAAAGNHEQALELLSQAVDTDPKNSKYLLSIGRLLAEQAMLNQAALAYLRAQELSPDDTAILTELAGLLHRLDREEEATALLVRACHLQRRTDSCVPGRSVGKSPLLLEGLLFDDLHLYGDTNGASIIGRSVDGKHFLKIEVRHNPLKKLTLEGERQIIEDLNRQHCVTCPTLAYYGALPHPALERCLALPNRAILTAVAESSYRYIIQQFVPATAAPTLGDILLALLEQKALGVFHADLRPENCRMDNATGVCYLIDYDQAERLDDTTRNLDNPEFFAWCDELVRDKYRQWNFQHFLHYFPNVDRARAFAILFRNGSFNLGSTRLFTNQITTAAKAGVYHTIREKAVFIDGERALDARRGYLDAIPFFPGERVLDVGCSSGIVTTYLTRRGCKVTGIDLDPEIVLGCRILAHILGNDTTFLHHDLDSGPVPGEFDTVVLFSVIHHTKNMQANAIQLARQSHRILIECRLLEGGLKPSRDNGWQMTSGWNFATVDDMVAGLEQLFPGFHLYKNYGQGDRDRYMLELKKSG